jgi:tetratricopeptide (TPR) repeat protein
LRDALRETPATIPCLAAIVLFVVWAGNQAGYPVTHWAPGALLLVALLAIALLSARPRLHAIPVSVRVAIVCLALYTALSFLSILWAHVQGDAWEGANRTLLYLVVFTLFALWPQRGLSAALLVGLWAIAMIGLAAFVLLHVNAATHLSALFSEGRLKYPGDYENANAATWAMVSWPALLLASSDRIHWAVRGVLAGGAVLLADVALLSLSRGSLYSTPVMLILVFALLPGRLRTFATLIPIAIGIAVTAPGILRVGDRLTEGGDVKSAMHAATAHTLAAAVVVALLFAAAAALERRTTLSEVSLRRTRRGVSALALATLVAIVAGGLVAAGNPVTRVEHAWETFKGGYSANSNSGSRLTSGFGSDRYDFYRVALNEFVAHPLVGIGADNFAQQYLAHGRGQETPHYPHSVELRTLAQTGLVGALLALAGLAAALLAGGRVILSAAARRRDPLAAAVAAAALAGFGYWMVHGSFDWFWEFAGLGAPAFALLGIVCALAVRERAAASDGAEGTAVGVRQAQAAASAPAGQPARRGVAAGIRRPALVGAFVLVALAAVVSLATPWFSQLQIQRAVHVWPTAPRQAYADLNDAASLNPLSDEAYLLGGSIALRFGDLERADHEFSLALRRNSRDAYATLELGAIASARGRQARALKLLKRTSRLNPRDELIQEALRFVSSGHKVNIEQLNRLILLKAQKLT